MLALRKDLPYVPHLNPRDEEIPRSLCLYEESFDELRLTWTPSAFVERVRWWLSETRLQEVNVPTASELTGVVLRESEIALAHFNQIVASRSPVQE